VRGACQNPLHAAFPENGGSAATKSAATKEVARYFQARCCYHLTAAFAQVPASLPFPEGVISWPVC
jgi:hypothetical protein